MNKNARMYSLFEKRDGQWVRISSYAYFLKVARNLFQDTMINAFFEGKEQMLRPVRDE